MAAAKGSFPSLARCFRAWQRFVQRGAQCRRHLAHQRVRILRVCLGQWMEMKQLQASDVTKVTQLSLYRRKAGKPVANSGSGAGVGVGWGWGSLQPKLQLIKLQSPVKLMNITWERTLLSWVLGRGWGVGGREACPLGGVPEGSGLAGLHSCRSTFYHESMWPSAPGRPFPRWGRWGLEAALWGACGLSKQRPHHVLPSSQGIRPSAS